MYSRRLYFDDNIYLIGMLFNVKKDDEDEEASVYVSFTLLPSPFPRQHYNHIKSTQTIINTLIDNISRDYKFLKDALER